MLLSNVTALLNVASQSQPLVLVLDNLHWADVPSLLLLEFLAQNMGDGRLLVIGTYRDAGLSREHPLAHALGELIKERHFQRMTLLGLTHEDVGRQ